jgi:hypothetical protein
VRVQRRRRRPGVLPVEPRRQRRTYVVACHEGIVDPDDGKVPDVARAINGPKDPVRRVTAA